MTLKDQLDALLDAAAFDSSGTKIGAVRQVYVDDATGKITFATVATGIFSSDAIVPLHGARLLDGELHVDHTRSAVKDSPRPDHTEDALTPDQERELLEHYGVESPTRGRPSGPARTDDAPKADEPKANAPKADEPKRADAQKRAAGEKPTGQGERARSDKAEKDGKGTTTSSPTPDAPDPKSADRRTPASGDPATATGREGETDSASGSGARS